MLSADSILDALKGVKYPGYSRDIVSFGLVKKENIAVQSGGITVLIALTSNNADAAKQIKEESERILRSLPGVAQAHVEVKQPSSGPAGASGPSGMPQPNRLANVKRIIAIASGKGGVGKSTCSVNLACALQQLGARVGLLDCDIYGPSIPLMMGVNHRPSVSEDEKLIPIQSHGIHLMSMGFLIDGDMPVIWRGPMIVKTIQQFIFAVEWGQLDYLLVDLPPGTGDAQLTLCQTVPLDGGVIITTPQEASLGVVRKGIGMFEKVHVPILGLVENMSYFMTPNGERVEIFGHGGGRKEAERLKVPFLGEIPLFTSIREGGDRGVPVVVSSTKEPAAQAFLSIAKNLQSLPALS